MDVHIYPNKLMMGTDAAWYTADLLQEAIANRGMANLILATGASQFEMLSNLVTRDIAWAKVNVFHLDEYIGLPISHPASFRKYLKERFVQHVPGLCNFNYINAELDPGMECKRLNDLIRNLTIDVACIGIGENGHLAFNDPPADFDTKEPYIIVDLDHGCQQQQVGEGWFATLDDVPKQAISMSISQIMKSEAIICTVPDARKADAVKKAVEGPVTNLVPASILQTHPRCWLFMDEAAAEKLE